MTAKNIHKVFIPQKYLFFWKTLKIWKFKIWTQKTDQSLSMYETISVSPLGAKAQ